MLSTVPRGPIADGIPAFGTYAGRCEETDLQLSARGVSRIRQAISEKRWHWFGAFDDRLAVGGAIVDAGLFGTAFLWVFDRQASELLADTEVVVPAPLLHVDTTPAKGMVARIDLPRRRLTIARTAEMIRVNGQFGKTRLSLRFDTTGDAVTAICPVLDREEGVNVTQKETGASVTGSVHLDRTYRFDGTGMADYSHGLLSRTTEWQWAIGNCTGESGRQIGFNLVDGFNGGLENAVWIDGTPQAVEDATFEMGDPDSKADWHVQTDCNTVDLTLSVEGSRSQDLNVGVVRSAYRQPLGRWSGTIDGEDVEGVGVAEYHLAKW